MEIFSPFRKFAEFVQSRFWSTDATLQKHNLKSCAVVSLSKRTNISLCYVMWNLFTVGSIQFSHDSTITTLEANKKT